jgi:hypothetical protein
MQCPCMNDWCRWNKLAGHLRDPRLREQCHVEIAAALEELQRRYAKVCARTSCVCVCVCVCEYMHMCVHAHCVCAFARVYVCWFVWFEIVYQCFD